MAQITEHGVWLDKESGKVVHKRPTRGRQIVAPGHQVTAADQATIDLYQANSDTFTAEQAVAPPEKPFPNAEPDPVMAPAKKAPAKAPAKKAAAKS